MKEATYEDKRLWENIFASKEYHQKEKVTTEGNDGEDEFDAKMLDAVAGKTVLDVSELKIPFYLGL